MMFSQTSRYIVQRSHNQWGSESQNWKRHQAVWRPPYFSEKTQTEVVRAHHTIIWTGQDYPTGNSTGWGGGRETRRQTEETMGRQHQRVDWLWMEHHTAESENREEWRKLVVKSPVVPQTVSLIRDRWRWSFIGKCVIPPDLELLILLSVLYSCFHSPKTWCLSLLFLFQRMSNTAFVVIRGVNTVSEHDSFQRRHPDVHTLKKICFCFFFLGFLATQVTCTAGADLLTSIYVLAHRDRNRRSDLLGRPVKTTTTTKTQKNDTGPTSPSSNAITPGT